MQTVWSRIFDKQILDTFKFDLRLNNIFQSKNIEAGKLLQSIPLPEH